MGHHHLDKFQTLILNADYTPLSLSPLGLMAWQETAFAVVTNKYIVVDEYDCVVRSSNRNSKGTATEFYLPSVVALKKYRNQSKPAVFNRHNIYARDGWTCQYCGKRFKPSELTFDHLVPQSTGGKTCWNNIVTACVSCNGAKGSKSLKEFKALTGLDLRRKPFTPTKAELNDLVRKNPPIFTSLHESWLPYLGFEISPTTKIVKTGMTNPAFPEGMSDEAYWSVQLEN